MPLTPDEARRKRVEKAKPEAEKHFNMIDEKLCSEEWPLSITFPISSNMVLECIKAAYTGKGWSVSQTGNSLTFREPPHYPSGKD